MNFSKCVDNVLLSLPREKKRKIVKGKKSLVLGGAGCCLGATDPKDLQTTKEKTKMTNYY